MGGTRRHAPVLSVADREADIYELLAACQQTRAEHGGGPDCWCAASTTASLRTAARSCGKAHADPARDRHARGRAAARQARAQGPQGHPRGAGRAGSAGGSRPQEEIPRPFRQHGLWALEVRETDPPPGVEPVCWQLLTTEPVTGCRRRRASGRLVCLALADRGLPPRAQDRLPGGKPASARCGEAQGLHRAGHGGGGAPAVHGLAGADQPGATGGRLAGSRPNGRCLPSMRREAGRRRRARRRPDKRCG